MRKDIMRIIYILAGFGCSFSIALNTDNREAAICCAILYGAVIISHEIKGG